MPARLSAASISFPPPWIITTGAPDLTIEATPATTAARLPRSSRSSPPNFRTRGRADVTATSRSTLSKLSTTEDTGDTDDRSCTFLPPRPPCPPWWRASRSWQTRPLVETQHHVHVLHGLTRRAFQQVVDHRDEDRAARRIDAPA